MCVSLEKLIVCKYFVRELRSMLSGRLRFRLVVSKCVARVGHSICALHFPAAGLDGYFAENAAPGLFEPSVELLIRLSLTSKETTEYHLLSLCSVRRQTRGLA